MNADLSVLQQIQQLVSSITAENDAKLQEVNSKNDCNKLSSH